MMRAQTALEKQGDVDFKQKTKTELIDLLARQEKLLANKKFLSRLQDRGEKVERFAEQLRMVLAEREEVERTTQLFEQMDIGKEDAAVTDITQRVTSPVQPTKDTETERDLVQVKMAYDHGPTHDRRENFKLNRELKSTAIPSDLQRPNVMPSPSKSQRSKEMLTEEQAGVELSAVTVPPLRNLEAQVVEMDESARLLQAQKHSAETLLARHAAERLAERHHVKMGDGFPHMQDKSYRIQSESIGEDSDDESAEDEETDNEEEDD